MVPGALYLWFPSDLPRGKASSSCLTVKPRLYMYFADVSGSVWQDHSHFDRRGSFAQPV